MGTFKVNGAIESTGNVSCVKTGARYLVNNNTLELWFGINTDGSAWGIYNNTDGAYIVKQTSSATTFYGNASTATKLATARTISLTGSITGSGTFDGSGNLSIATTTNHSHSYLPLSGGTMTGTIVTPGNDSVVIKPAYNNYDQIGASDCKFWKIYATTFYGNLSGNADTATTASAVAWANITGKPSTFAPSSHTHDYLPTSGGTVSGGLWVAGSSGEIQLGLNYGSGSRMTYLYSQGAGKNRGLYDNHVGSIFLITDSGATFYGSITGNANYATSAGSATSATYAGYLPSYAEYSTTSALNGFITDGVMRWAKVNSAALSFGNDGSVISVGWGGGYGSQVWLDDGSGPAKIAVRNRSGGSSWNAWRHCVMSCSETYYGSSLPSSGNVGDVFFKT